MTVNLYNAQIAPRRRVTNKTLIVSAVGSLRAGTSVENPNIERLALGSAPAAANYMEIPEFGRSYFITDMQSEPTNGIWSISGHVDVLTSMWEQVAAQGAILRRQTNQNNLYLPDPMFPLQARRSAEVVTFPKGLTASQAGSCCVLTIMGATTS